ncbi:MAG: hypothetical protein ACYC6A_21575 [Armatimonadota bacterium]
MPMEIEQDGQKVTVYTAEELAAEKAAVEKAAAEKAAEETRRALEADPNGQAAKARREAEGKLKAAEKEKDTLLAQLTEAGKTAEQLKEVGEKLAAATKDAEDAKKAITDVQATHQRDLQLIGDGVQAGKLAELKAVLGVRGVDVNDAAAVTVALPALKTEMPGLFGEVKAPPYNPNPGPTNPPTKTGEPTPEELEAMTPEQFHQYMTKKGK